MAMTVELNDEAQSRLERLMMDCGFATAQEAVMHSLKALQDAHEEFSPEELASIRRGLAELDAGQEIPAEDVFAELRARYAD